MWLRGVKIVDWIVLVMESLCEVMRLSFVSFLLDLDG